MNDQRHNDAPATTARTLFGVAGPPERMPRERFSRPLVGLLDYWLAKRGTRRAPAYADIDPVEMPSLLPHLMLWTVVPPDDGAETPSFRCRLAGEATRPAAGPSFAGKTLEELNRENFPLSNPEFLLVATTLDLHYVERTAHWIQRPFRFYRRLLLPLSPADGIADNLISAITLHDSPDPSLR